MNRILSVPFEADLHCHTHASDGQLSPRELVQLAASHGLSAIGITDHDTIAGWTEACRAGKETQIDVLCGVELSTEWEGKEIHILGYELDESSIEFRNYLLEFTNNRKIHIQKILLKLNSLGIPISMDTVFAKVYGEAVGRPHIAQALVDGGFVADTKEAFRRYLGKGAAAYVTRNKLTVENAIKLIRKASGVAVLAHPGKNRSAKMIHQCVIAGLQGIEVSHPDHNDETEKFWRGVADQYHLIKTGGSDFHGRDSKPGIEIGCRGVNYQTVDKIRRLASQNRYKVNN